MRLAKSIEVDERIIVDGRRVIIIQKIDGKMRALEILFTRESKIDEFFNKAKTLSKVFPHHIPLSVLLELARKVDPKALAYITE